MRVSYEWLKELVDIPATSKEVAERLTMSGFEVEGEELVDNDRVFEVGVTPNRPDCLSMLGIARELSAAFKVPLKIPEHDIPDIEEYQTESDFLVEILQPALCNRYAGRLITGVSISNSPEWIKKRLEKSGVRPINNVVDITNYVLLEFGHPLHAFDADKIDGRKIKIDIAGSNNKIVTLDGVERKLKDDALLIWDDKRPIAIAGIMGGLNTEVTEKTENIFLESAYFDPFSIRMTSKFLNLKSESSYRFERGTDIEFLVKALNRATLLIKEIAGGKIHKMIDVYPVKREIRPLEIRYEKINKLLGTNIQKSIVLEILKSLDFYVEDRDDIFLLYPPSHRRDITMENDVAEEIARLYGYDKIPVTIPKSPLPKASLDKKTAYVKSLKEAFKKAGFTEVINYSFMNPSNLDMLEIPALDKRRNAIVLSNPLTTEDTMLRTTLIPSLLKNLKYNMDRGIKEIRLFEVSLVFEDTGSTLPVEKLKAGGIFYKDKIPSLWKDDTEKFFIVKGVIESILDDLKVKNYKFLPSTQTFLQEGKSTDIYISDSFAGYLGVLNPRVVEKLDLKKHAPEIILFEIDLEVLFSYVTQSVQYIPIPKYPYIERDVSIIVDEDIPAIKIKDIIMSYPSELIEEVSIFDYYKGSNIPSSKKSVALNILYRSKEKTLTDEEVERIHLSLIKYLIENTGGELRK